MKISQEIRASAEAGMQEKAKEFRDAGGEIYVPQIRILNPEAEVVPHVVPLLRTEKGG